MIEFTHLLEIEDLISKNNWKTKLNKNDQNVGDLVFELFDLVDTQDQYDVIKSLVERFTVLNDYEVYARRIAREIESVFKDEKVVIVPVSDDVENIKSGHNVCYEIYAFINKNKFKEFQIKERVPEEIFADKDYYIVAIDDFVGTGSQSKKFFRNLNEVHKIDKGRLFLFCIAMMNSAKIRLNGRCFGIWSIECYTRAISDNLGGFEIKNPLQVYDEIENKLNIGKNFKNGFMGTEALITFKENAEQYIANILVFKRKDQSMASIISTMKLSTIEELILKAILSEGSLIGLRQQGYASAQVALALRGLTDRGVISQQKDKLIVDEKFLSALSVNEHKKWIDLRIDKKIEKIPLDAIHEIGHRTISQIRDRVRSGGESH